MADIKAERKEVTECAASWQLATDVIMGCPALDNWDDGTGVASPAVARSRQPVALPLQLLIHYVAGLNDFLWAYVSLLLCCFKRGEAPEAARGHQ